MGIPIPKSSSLGHNNAAPHGHPQTTTFIPQPLLMPNSIHFLCLFVLVSALKGPPFLYLSTWQGFDTYNIATLPLSRIHRSPIFLQCSKCYRGKPQTSQSFPLWVFSNVQCGHTRPPLVPLLSLSPRVGVAISSNSSGGISLSSSRKRAGGTSGAGCVGR